MLRLLQIYQQSTGRSDSKRETVDGETFERIHSELPLELLHGAVIYECPFFQSGNVVMIAVSFLRSLFITSRHEKFLRSERTEKGADVVKAAFSYLECSCRDIQKSHSALVLEESQTGDVIVLLLFEELFVKSHTRSDQFGDSTLDYILGQFRVFKLVTDRYLVARTDKSRKICFK